ncbi:MAG: hypothetical protein Q7S14_03390 [bacterium]|nr:hypothetical protein [bacterium]
MIKEAFKNGWQKFKENWKLLVVVQIISIILSAIFNSLTENYPLVIIPTVILGVIMGIGITKIYLKVFDGESASIKDLFLHYKLFLKFIFAQFVSGLVGIVAVIPLILATLLPVLINNNMTLIVGLVLGSAGLVFLIHVSIRLMFVQYLVVDKQLGPVAAVKGSFAVTKGHVLSLLGFGVVSFLVVILGVLALFVGLFVAIPVISLATVFVYREFSK